MLPLRNYALRLCIVFAVVCLSSAAEARRHSYNCGQYMASITGRYFPGHAMARQWARSLPHTFARPGAVVVQARAGRALGGGPGGHVSRIVEVTGPCRATVQDERGTYSRDICKRLIAYVQP